MIDTLTEPVWTVRVDAPEQGVRIITIDNPPVNALSFALSEELLSAVETAEGDAAVRAVIFTGANGIFSGGADVNDFAAEPTTETVTIRDVVARVERGMKTYIAAIDGNALGGGFELALACDYRIATARSKVGLPEIKLGLIPGAGGTQRLPRALGAQDALQMMLKGESIKAADAKAKGVLDEVVEDDVLAAALVFVARVLAREAPELGPGTQGFRAEAGALQPEARSLPMELKRRISERAAELGVANLGLFATPFVVAKAHKMVPPEENGGFAAHKLIDAVQAAIELPFARGVAREARLFDELVRSAPSLALRHVFFAERELAKIPDLPQTAPLDIKTAAVIGAGTMGTGIAITFAQAGIPVVVIDSSDAAVEKARATIFGMFKYQVDKGRLTQQEAWKLANSISFEDDFAAISEVDVVVEAVFESMDVKKDVFAKLDAAAKPQAILASNTSTLDIDEIAAVTKHPERVLGLHFFAPANIMKLLEIVRGKATSPQTLVTGVKLAKTLRKIGVVSGNAFGFIGNRMLFAYEREAITLAEEGVAPARIDAVMKDRFGFAMGPFAVADLSGLDVYRHIERAANEQLGRIPIVARLVDGGRLGQKSGAGFFRYDKAVGKGREPIPAPHVDELIARLAREAGIAQRSDITDDEIVARLTRALIDTGADLVRTGIALRPGDVDLVWIYGYGFPPHRGGPMWYAEHA
ncbi:MAG: 3-hydroxyacyl-CoA dehydrogenase NAD-binding domain-containing protein [Candidatus Eremiobacteraeota bacterium]|nr:3-hydroxyacyl-CoA dehydrogenase NAD-binding domain-containing protein [Candidatus Eremiobacteraeota bacterium]